MSLQDLIILSQKCEELEAKNGELLEKLKQCGCGDYIGNCSCWTREIEGMTFRISEIEKKLEIAMEALKFYANEETWFDQDLIGYPIALDDEGKYSREALEAIKGK
jgi:hypothetical protein